MRYLLLLISLLCFLVQPAKASDFVSFGVRASANAGGMFLPTTGLQFLYSMVQQRGYGGPCMKVTKSGGATLDIGFKNGYCDTAAAFTFGGASVTCTTIYDQSGNGFNNPGCGSLNSSDIIGTKQGITNDLGTITLPAGLSFNRQSETGISVSSTLDAALGVQYQFGSVLFSSVTPSQRVNQSDVLFMGTGPGFLSTGLYGPTTKPNVTIMTSSTSGTTFRENNQTSGLLTVQPAGTVTGGYMFSAASSFSFYGSYYLLAAYNRVLSNAEITSVQSQLFPIFGVLSNPTVQLIEDGDSITEGTCATFSLNSTYYLDSLTTYPIRIRNIGIFGQQGSVGLANETSNIINAYDATLAANLVEYRYGTNDLAAGVTGTNAFNNATVPYVANARAKGFKVLVGTIIFRGGQSAAFETERQIYNGLVRSNAVALGYTVVDYDALGVVPTCDGTHPISVGGYSAMGAVDATAVNTLLP